jgi:class 3 adenylate cyclase/tetratricopeptide (TPR) repeat protein
MLDGTFVFADVSGFTRLSERLARIGSEGAELLVDAINSCFSALLADAYAQGGSLVKFGGDALLLWFEGAGHEERACSSAFAMQQTIRRVGRVHAGPTETVLRMSVGIHSGRYAMFLVGDSNRELIVAGRAASTVVAMEAAASAGQILVSSDTAAHLPHDCLGSARGPGVLLKREPPRRLPPPTEPPARPADELIAGCLPVELRRHVLSSPAAPEHRAVTVGFVQFGDLDDLIERRGPTEAAALLDGFVRSAQKALDRYEVCLIASDIATDGGKLYICSGAPRAVGDDEERILLAVRQIMTADQPLPVRAGVNRGRAFAGEIGPPYRRSYSVMGDTVNLAARLMGAAPWGKIYATRGVLERSQTAFEESAVPPLKVKGKLRPVEAFEVGPARRAEIPRGAAKRLPLLGREPELQAIQSGVADAREGLGALIEIVGETGSGKSRLLAEARELAEDMRFMHATCEAYTRDVPYVGWRDPLRQLLGVNWDDPDEVVVAHLEDALEREHPELMPWLPLIGIAIDAHVPMTREVDDLAEEFRTAKLHEVVLRFLAPALQVPTLVQIEHAHLMDDASAGLLHALTPVLESSSWMVIVTRRDVEGGFVATEESAVRLELGPLPREAMMELAEAAPEAERLPPHVLVEAVERSGGSPEALLDLLAAADKRSGELPDSVEAAANARIDALDPGDRKFVQRAAVLGVSFHPGRLRDVLEPDSAAPDDDGWQRLGPIFARDPDGHVRFKRPALQEAAYQRLPFRLRRELHAAVASSLERDRGHDVDAEPGVLSLHFILAGDYARAWRYAKAGAERAVASFAHADAARLYRRAIEAGRHHGAQDTELAAVWESLGVALHRTGELDEATRAIATARRLLADDPVAQGRLLYRHMRIAEHSNRLTTALRWGRRGLRELDGLERHDAIVWRARTLARIAFYRSRQGKPLQAERLSRAAIAEAEPVGELEAQAYAYYMLDLALFDGGREEEMGYSARALQIYSRLGDLEEQASVLNNLGVFALERWRWDEAIPLLERSGDCYERAGIPGGVAFSAVNIGEIMLDRGRFDEASLHLHRARRLWSRTGDRPMTAYATVLLGRLAVREHRYSDGLALLREGANELRQLGEKGYAEFAETLLAEGEAVGGEPQRALKTADGLIPAADRMLPLLHRVRAIALARLGLDGAGDALERSIQAARERGALFDIAAGLELAEQLVRPDPEWRRELDAIVAQLGVERLPETPVGREVQDLAAALG